MNDLQVAMNNLAGSIGSLTDSQKRASDKQNINTTNVNNEFSNLSKSAQHASAAQESIATANKKYAESMKEFNNAVTSSVTGLKSFTNALLDSNRSFGKYTGTVTSFGDALASVLKAFGPLGAVLGGVVKGMTKVAEAALQQADNVTKAYDDLAKVGGAGGISTKQIMEMGLQAGLMSKDLGKLTGVIRSNSKDIAGLGSTAADGMKAFGQITAVGSKTIATYSKLGVSQEELIKTQGDYIALQMASGRSLKGELNDKVKLQKATLEYQDNLLMLSNLTGENVEEIKKKQKEALYELNWQIKNRQDQNKIADLEKQGRLTEAAALKAEVENRNKGLQAVAAIGSKGLTQAVREIQASGTATSKGAQAMIRAGMGPAIAEYNKTIKEGGDANKAAAKLQQAYNEAQNKVINQVGTAAGLSQDIAESFDLTAENVQRGTQQSKDLVTAQGQAAAAVQAGKTKADPALDARAKLTRLEIEAGTALERFLMKINPLLSGFNPETIAGMVATGAAVAVAGWLGTKLLGGVFGGGKGGGMPGPGIPSTGGVGAGGKAAGAGKGLPGKAAGGLPPGLGGAVETLGKNDGNFLEGAARGLKAFADPRVAVGAVAFGAAITAVGAGIAGATWIISKALPSLADGLQPFEKLNGEKLIQAGKGVGAIGAGLAVFGAGGAAAGIGSIIGGLGESIGSFFGAKSPMEKLVEFGKLDINGKKVEENAKAFAAFSAAMAAGGLASSIEGLGTTVSAIGGAVTSFFKVDPPFKKFVEFSNLDINVPKTKQNADAFVAFSKAMATGAAGIAEGFGSIVSALGSAVTSFFKVEPPLKKFVEFSELKVDPIKTKTNAEAFANFSMAMAKSGLGSAASGLGNLVSGVADGIGKLFGNKDAITKFVEFTKLDVDPDKAEKLGIAFAAYVSALQGVSGAAMPAVSSSRPGGAAPGGAGSSGGAPGGGAPGGAAPSGGGGTRPSGSGSSSQPLPGSHSGEQAGSRPQSQTAGKAIDPLEQVKQAGLKIRPYGDVYQGGPLSDTAVSVAKSIQNNIEGFGMWTGLNDVYHKEKHPRSTHAVGRGLDMTMGKMPTPEESKALKAQMLKIPGVKSVHNEYYKPPIGDMNQYTTGPHFHIDAQARNGGMFRGPNSGYPVTLHGNELVIPDFKLPGLKAAMEQTSKQELPFGSSSNTSGSSSGDGAQLMLDLYSMMEDKFNNLINAVEQSNSTQTKILKYSRA
jgi:hypothetical protein